MSLLVNKMSGVCWKCTEKQTGQSYSDNPKNPCIRSYDLVRAAMTGRHGGQIIDCWECRECHNLVPVETWTRYAATGEVVVKETRERKRK